MRYLECLPRVMATAVAALSILLGGCGGGNPNGNGDGTLSLVINFPPQPDQVDTRAIPATTNSFRARVTDPATGTTLTDDRIVAREAGTTQKVIIRGLRPGAVKGEIWAYRSTNATGDAIAHGDAGGAIVAGRMTTITVVLTETPMLTLSALQVAPSEIPVTGGSIQVSVNVATTGSAVISKVSATITHVTPVTVDLTNDGTGHCTCTSTIPANEDTQSRTYTVSARAWDGENQEYSYPGQPAQVTVPANAPPTVTSATIAPTELRYVGGPVTITVTAIDDEQVNEVSAEVTGPSGTTSILLTPVGQEYQGTYPASENGGPGDAAYDVTIVATDIRGHASAPTEISPAFTVRAPLPPPPEPGM